MEHILFVSYNNDTFSNPTLDLLFKKILERDVRITFLAPEQCFFSEYSRAVSRIDIPPVLIRKSKNPLRLFKQLKPYISLIADLWKSRPDAICGIDPAGFITAARLNSFLGCKLGYLSFEIFFEDEANEYFRRTGVDYFLLLKSTEKKFFRKLDFLVIQDKIREALLVTENGHKPEKSFLIPVSSARNGAVKKKHSSGADFGIPKGKNVIVYSGSLDEWTGIPDLLEYMDKKWDNRFWLMLHSRFVLEDSHPVKEKVLFLQRKNCPVSLHDKPFGSQKDLENFLTGFDFGIVGYKGGNNPYTGKNILNIGLSSGKFSMFMMLGLPVIVTECSTYRMLRSEYDFGVLVRSMEELPENLYQLLDRGEERSMECLRLYREKLEPGEKMDRLITDIIEK